MILCCGEALIDMIPQSHGGYVPFSGGAVFNTAIALGRLGAPTAFFSGLSTDFFGDQLAQALTDSGVDASPCKRADRPCTLAFVRLVDGHATYAFYDENTAGRLLGIDDLPMVDAQALFFGGISLMVEPCGATYEALMLREAGTRVTMIDPNIRPGFIKDEARYRARLSAMLPRADIIKISDEDLAWIAARETGGDSQAYVQQLLGQGVAMVLRTDGSKGATAMTARGQVSVPARTVTVVDTVGAGDTFNAGVLAGLHRLGLLDKAALRQIDDSALRQILTLGAAAAGVTVSRAGANPPWAHELD